MSYRLPQHAHTWHRLITISVIGMLLYCTPAAAVGPTAINTATPMMSRAAAAGLATTAAVAVHNTQPNSSLDLAASIVAGKCQSNMT